MSEKAKEEKLQPSDFDYLDRTLTDISAFSIVFSPAGKLITHDIRIRNRHGKWRPPDTVITVIAGKAPKGSTDTVFNSFINMIDKDTGQFVQDDYAQNGLGGEKSRREFYIYDCEKFQKMTDKTQRYNYLNSLKPQFINHYSGELIK